MLKDRLARLGTAVRSALERRRLRTLREQAEEELRVTFENAPLGVSLIETGGHFLKTNRALQQIPGYSGEELRGRPFSEFTHPDDLESGKIVHQEMLEGKRETEPGRDNSFS